MAASTLDPDNMPEPDRQLGKGHGTNALGPSDRSDTGSDVQPGLKAIEEDVLGLDRGTTEDPDSHLIDVSTDTDDSTATGESSTAGRNADVELAGDINVDRIDEVNIADELLEEELNPDQSADSRPPPASRQAGMPQAPKR